MRGKEDSSPGCFAPHTGPGHHFHNSFPAEAPWSPPAINVGHSVPGSGTHIHSPLRPAIHGHVQASSLGRQFLPWVTRQGFPGVFSTTRPWPWPLRPNVSFADTVRVLKVLEPAARHAVPLQCATWVWVRVVVSGGMGDGGGGKQQGFTT
jgi:hypothetical protein